MKKRNKKKVRKHKTIINPEFYYKRGLHLYFEKGAVDDGLKHLLKSAEAGHKKAYGDIGLILYREKNDPIQAEDWFKKAEEADSLTPEAAYEYGMLYHLEKDNWETGLSYLMQSAEGGYELAYGDIGSILYLYKSDIDNAIKWFEKAEATDCFLAPAAYYYGLLLSLEKKDWEKSFRFFKQAANEGFDLAYGEYASALCEKGEFDDAEKWFESAVEADALIAPHAYEYGMLLIKERGDSIRGNLYLEMAAEDGYD